MMLGLNFFGHSNSSKPQYTDIGDIIKLEVKNGIYDEIKIDNKIISNDKTKEAWGISTILLSKFENNLNGGNVDFTGLSISKLRLKRRKLEDLNGWWSIAEVPYKDENQFSFEFFDNFNESDQQYEYALVPILDNGTEGNYITNTVLSEFDGAFIVDKNYNFKLYYNLEYGNIQRIRPNSKYEPIGSKYPIIVSNGNINYEQGSIRALILTDDVVDNGATLDSKTELKSRQALLKFLTNSKPKILKDSIGNIRCVMIQGNPTLETNNDIKALANVNFNWCEIADANDKIDLYNAGLLGGEAV
jgi:hypothetical protein